MAESTHELNHDAIRGALAARRWTPEALAAVSGVDRRTVRRVLDPHAPRKVVRAETAQRLARALGVRPAELAPGCPEGGPRPRPKYNRRRMVRQAPELEEAA